MNSVLLHFTISATVLFTLFILPNEIACCSYNQSDITDLIHRDPNFLRNPCYIQWKARHDAMRIAKWQMTFRKTVTKDPSEYQQRELENSNFWMVLGMVTGIGFCATFISFLRKVNHATRNNINIYRRSGVSLTTRRDPGNARENQRRPNSLRGNDVNNLTNPIIIGMEFQSDTAPLRRSIIQQRTGSNSQQYLEANPPLLVRGVMNTEDSLPSYEEALKMVS